MPTSELAQIEMLAAVDNLIHQLKQWSEQQTHWKTAQQCQAVIQQLLPRLGMLRNGNRKKQPRQCADRIVLHDIRTPATDNNKTGPDRASGD